MKKLMLLGFGCLVFAGFGAFSKAEAGVQVSINLGAPPRYYAPARSYPVYSPCPPPVVVYHRAPVYYGRPVYASRPYYAPYSRPVYVSHRQPVVCR